MISGKMPLSSRIHKTLVKRVLIATALIGWFGQTSCGAADTPPIPSPVKSFTIEQKTVPEWSEYHGVVSSRNTVNLIALVMGKVKAVHVKAGQRVHKGELLVEMESDDLRAKLQVAKSRLAAAEASLVEASNTYERFKELALKGMISKLKMDETTARWRNAQADVEAAKAQMEEAKTMLDYTALKSPMNGIVVDKRVNPGDFSIPGLPAELGYPAGRILMTVYDPDKLWFEARIPERFSQQVTAGAKAGVSIASANLSLESKFVEVLPEVDDTTRTFTARVDLPSLSALKIGMFGRARFVSGQRKLIEIPESALVQRGQIDAVFVLSDGRARLRLVRSGKQRSGKVDILSGLVAGEKIILNPGENLRDGDPVKAGS
jgi:RND family efflux transporter MFP subunit